ncbi:golgin candidate 4 isoform X2 [Ricinus communis]|uniref:golgin candidate 4 isoform X2 n=1 Tax=Ricinus communis TaxID=3988 RepID=UPI0007727D05|nr:golgin candidate 4 isoform X2 [Ricinus communis]|eukprot:XP_015584426.1 golgin candidate 4 isoform X2 [Ricinus communis]
MWSSIEALKQNLNKIALDVHDDGDEEELEIYASINDGDYSDRRNSHSFAHSKPALRSPIANGIDSSFHSEIEQYKAEIRRLQESESEIKALSVNYAALLKEKEDQISRLNQENGSLKHNLDATEEALNVSRSENPKASTNNTHVIKGAVDQSPNQQHKSATQAKSRNVGNQMQNGVFSKQEGVGNGIIRSDQADAIHQGKEKELADLLEEKNRLVAAMQATHELQIKQLRLELEKERDKVTNVQIKLQEEHKLNESFQEQVRTLKMGESKTSMEMSKIRNELNEKISEIRRLQIILSRREDENADDTVKGLKRVLATLEKENANLKIAKNELEAALETSRNASPGETSLDGVDPSGSFNAKEMESSLQKLEKELKETRHERDKALQELSRLKQHLLDKENEESEKMDEDSKIIEELRENNEYQKAQVLHLEKALKQAIANQEEVRMINNNEIQKSKEIIEDLNKKLANCMSIIDSKNVELLNLQTALGQYFAEIEAKEQLERNLALAREETAKLSELLKDAEQGTEALKKEKEKILAKLSHNERTLAEGKNRVNKLEEDNAKLRRVLEQSMSRLNRMSVDSDFLVDRRIVIKLLVTYFQRNHSKEVLDLMVRMLGFSNEDKQRIGIAQQGGRGVVRGVLGLPGRLVGGILGGSSSDAHANAASENQSFADLWVDFLLKQTEERERRESAENRGGLMEDSQGQSPISGSPTPPSIPNTAGTISGISRPKFSPTPDYSPLPVQGNLRPFEHSDSEFSTVPLTSSDSTSRISRLLKH